MANEIKAKYLTGRNLYAVIIRGDTGYVWNGTDFVALNDSNWSTYAVPLAEQSWTGVYYADMVDATPGLYDIIVFQRVGATPQTTDNMVAQGNLDWSGSQDLGFSTVTGSGVVIVDHNYGGLDNLSYQTIEGAGITGAQIKAYTREDFDANRVTSSYVVAATTTKEMGRWLKQMGLNPGDYAIQFIKPGAYGPDMKYITVTE